VWCMTSDGFRRGKSAADRGHGIAERERGRHELAPSFYVRDFEPQDLNFADAVSFMICLESI
jgi:hypothetical protein